MKNKSLPILMALTLASIGALSACQTGENDSSENVSSPSSSLISSSSENHVHSYVHHDAIAPTCVEPGRAAYYTCEGCDKVFDESKNETTLDALTIEPLGHDFVDGVCSRGDLDISALLHGIDALPAATELNLGHVATVNGLMAQYNSLDEYGQKGLSADQKDKLSAAYDVTKGVSVISKADKVSSGGQCDQSLGESDPSFTLSQDDAYGEVATVTYQKWQWANFKWNEDYQPAVGTKVALAIYNALAVDAPINWGDGATVYNDPAEATLKSGWNLLTYDWTWEKDAIGAPYKISTQIYALSPAGTGTNLSGYQFSAMWSYTDEAAFQQLAANSAKVAEEKAKSEEAKKKAAELNEKLGTLTLADIPNIAEYQTTYASLSEELKATITNYEKLETLASLKYISSDCIAWGGQTSASDMSFTTSQKDEVYGNYALFTRNSSWANWHYETTESPSMYQGKYIAFYMYSPLTADIKLVWGTSATVYNAADDSNSVTLKASAWTKVSIKWDYAYGFNGNGNIFRFGDAAGDGTNVTGMKATDAYVLEDDTVIDAFVS